jgi:hypothetical protein
VRACGECGNWVPDASATCPRCGTNMAAAGVAPTAPAPPPAPPWAPPAQQWAPPATSAPPPYAGGWQPVDAKPRQPVWPRVLAWLAGVLAVLVVAAVVLALVFGDKSAAHLERYMKGKGITYQSADGRVTVRFPEQPKLEDVPVPLGDGTSGHAHLALLSRHTYEFGFTEFKLPAGIDAAHRRAGIKGAVLGGANGAHVALTNSGPTTFRGFEAYAGRGLAEDGSGLALISFTARDAIYTMFVHVDKDPTATMREYEQSLKIAP